MWTDPRHIVNWWGPKGFTTTIQEMDVKPGGVWRFVMHVPDGVDYQNKNVYVEVVEPERLVFDHVSGPRFRMSVTSRNRCAGAHGLRRFFYGQRWSLLRHPMSPTWPPEVLNTMILSEQGGKTILTLYGVPINATEEERKTVDSSHGSMKQGFTGTLDQLDAYLAKALEGGTD